MDFLLMDFQFMDFQLIDYIVYRLQLLMDFQFMDFQFMEYLLMKVIVDRVHVDGFDWVRLWSDGLMLNFGDVAAVKYTS